MYKFNRQQFYVPNIYGVKHLYSNQIYVVNHLPYEIVTGHRVRLHIGLYYNIVRFYTES